MPWRFPFTKLAPQPAASAGFRFFDPYPLVDGELELIPPHERWIDSILEICRDPRWTAVAPGIEQTTRESIQAAIDTSPGGYQFADGYNNIVNTYHFWMRCHLPELPPVVGSISLRASNNFDTVTYLGHLGYGVFPPARGRHYAERACRMLFNLCRRHNLNPVWITSNPDNLASRKTCQNLGGKLVDIVALPPGHILYNRGERQKCRYRIDL